MTTVERRQTERKLLEKQAYINIEPDNVGLVLNVSAGGLCFHSIDPIKHNGTIRFGLSGQKQRIEAEGVVVWNDETQRAGLRFTSLSAVARDRVRNWLSQSATFPPPMAPAAANVPVAKALADPPLSTFVGSSDGRRRIRLSGFSRGLATGLLLSVFVTAAFLFQGYRHEFGEWLIRTGERFAAKAQTETLAVGTPAPTISSGSHTTPATTPPAPKAERNAAKMVAPAPKTASVVPPVVPAAREEKVRPKHEQTAKVSAAPASPRTENSHPAGLSSGTAAVPVAIASAKLNSPAAATRPISQSSTTSDSPAPVVLAANSPKLDAAPITPSASQPGIHTEQSNSSNAPSTLQVFFEVGKFKNPLLAHDEADKVSRLGLPATAVHKHFLWASSYQVLVGPFSDEERAKTTHDTLVSNGFKPQTFERGSRSLILASAVSTEGGPAPEGEYVVSWESYIGNASVKFLRNNSLIATANAKWIPRGVTYRVDSYVYRKNPDGTHTLLEIHFGGMRQALVFGRSS